MASVARAICVSPDGQLFVPGTPSFSRHIGYMLPDFDVTGYAVRNMGFILLTFSTSNGADVRCRPRLLTVPAVSSACRELRRRDVLVVQLECAEDGTDPEHWPNYRALLARLGMSQSSY